MLLSDKENWGRSAYSSYLAENELKNESAAGTQLAKNRIKRKEQL
jgi:hypothetical protein